MISDFLTGRQAVGSSQWRKPSAPTNALTTFAAPASNPVSDAYESMFGRTDDGFGDGVGSGVSSGVSAGVSSGSTAGTYGAQPSFKTGRTVRNIGRALSLVAPGPIGTAVGFAGDLADLEEANAHLGARGFQSVDLFDAGLDAISMGMLGKSSVEQYNAMQGFGLGPAVEIDDMAYGAMHGNDPWGAWGGYGGFANIGPGADYESDPMGFSLDRGPVAVGGNMEAADWGTNVDDVGFGAGYGENDTTGSRSSRGRGRGGSGGAAGDLAGPSSGDIDDEAAGESDMGSSSY